MKKMKKIIIIIVIVFLLLVLIFWAFFGNPFSSQKDPCEEQVTSMEVKINNIESDYSNLLLIKDSLQKELNKCQGIPEPLTTEEQLQQIKEELKALKNRPRNAPARSAVRPSTPRNEDVSSFSFPNSGFTTNRVTTSSIPEVNTILASTQFTGTTNGSYLTTITDSYLTYKVKKNLSTEAPRLNTVNGPVFTEEGEYWVYIDKSRLISVAEINIATIIWTIYVGQKDYGTGTYPMFLPHESLKPLIVKARGYDYGAITSTDTEEMAKTNSQVGKSLIPNPADGKSATDKEFFNGWSFKTKIVAVKKTTTTTTTTVN